MQNNFGIAPVPTGTVAPVCVAPRIFLSHCGKDSGTTNLLHRLLEAEGLDVWYSRDDLEAGKTKTAKIMEALEETDIFLVVISKNTTDGAYGPGRNWVKTEIETFQRLHPSGKMLILNLDKINPDHVWLGLSEWVYIEAQDLDEGFKALWKELGIPYLSDRRAKAETARSKDRRNLNPALFSGDMSDAGCLGKRLRTGLLLAYAIHAESVRTAQLDFFEFAYVSPTRKALYERELINWLKREVNDEKYTFVNRETKKKCDASDVLSEAVSKSMNAVFDQIKAAPDSQEIIEDTRTMRFFEILSKNIWDVYDVEAVDRRVPRHVRNYSSSKNNFATRENENADSAVKAR